MMREVMVVEVARRRVVVDRNLMLMNCYGECGGCAQRCGRGCKGLGVVMARSTHSFAIY